MGLMTHAHTPERRHQAIEEARREEREAMAAYKQAAKYGSGPELLRLADEWRAARDRVAALEQAEALGELAPDASDRCWNCRRRFDRHVLRCRVSVATGLAACEACAERLDQLGKYHRRAFEVAA